MMRYNGIEFDTVEELIAYQRKMANAVVEEAPKERKTTTAKTSSGWKNVTQDKLYQKCKQILDKRSNKISVKQLLAQVYEREVSAPTASKFRKMVLEKFPDRISPETAPVKRQVQYMGKKKPSAYHQYLKDNIKRIMIEQKLDYFAASRIAQAQYSGKKQTTAKPEQKKYVPMPQIVPQNNGLLRQVVQDLLRKHIDRISNDYAEPLGVSPRDWDSFLLKFLQQSKNIAEHFDVANKFKMENGAIKYG